MSDSHHQDKSESSGSSVCSPSLVSRLRGIYTMPVDDGAGPLNGSDTFTRKFDGLPPINEEAAKAIERLTEQRNAAVKILAEWCVAVDTNGSSWDDWDEHYKDAMHRKTELPEMREILDAAIAAEREERSRF